MNHHTPFNPFPPSESEETAPIAPQPLIPQGWLRALLYFVFFLVISALMQGLGLFLLSVATGQGVNAILQSLETAEGTPYFLVVQIMALGGTMLATWLFRHFIDRQSVWSLGFDYRHRFNDAIMGFGVGAGLIAIGFVLLWAIGAIKIIGLHIHPLNLFLFVLLLIAVSLNEEISVRGYMLFNLLQSLDKYVALAISAVVFGVLHALNPNFSAVALLNIILAGVLLGIYYVHQKNLWFPFTLHFAWNFFQGPVFGFEVSGTNLSGIIEQEVSGSVWLTGGSFGFEGSVLLSVLLLAAIGFTHNLYKTTTQKETYPSNF